MSLIRLSVALALFSLSLLLGAAYYFQHFRHRDCFDDSGRCFDPETGVVYLEQAGMIWLVMAAITLAVSIYQFWRVRSQRRQKP